jgi:hypothetical protein
MVSFYFNVNWLIYTYCCTLLDAISADLTWQEMDHISDSNLELYQYSDSDSDSNSDSDPDCHPILEPVSIVENPLLEADSADSDTFTPGAADLPEVIQLLRKQLLSNYTPPNHPSIIDPRGRPLTEVEVLSLKHYLAWVDSRGTVKAYGLHAKVLEEVGNVELLTLYKVQKLAIELTGLSSQLVDMCPKSCMAFTGEFKNEHFCTYIRDKRNDVPCGQPCYDSKGHPRAQMIYTPIAPVIQSFYSNREMAEAMCYRHVHLQKALKRLEPDSPPTEYSDFSDSINHINQFCDSDLFQNETDTAITISGDGAQLTMKKQSDVWVLVVTILNLPPDMRSKAANIIIPLVIPGPHSPGNVESFVYVLYEELAKLSVGVWTKDALSGNFFLLKVYLCGVLGDMLGSAKLSRMAGHMAIYGCRFSTVQGARSGNKGTI